MRVLGRSLIVLVLAGILGYTAVRAETDEPTSVPPIPTLTLNKNIGTDEVTLMWTSTTSPYGVVRNIHPDFLAQGAPQIIVAGLGTTTFSDAVLTDGVDYFYLVQDVNGPTEVYGASADGGLPGDSITLTGLGFASVPADNLVYVGGKQAVVTGVTDTTLTFVIPTDAVSGSVVVSTSTGGASSGKEFYTVATDGLPEISSLGVDAQHTPFVATTGSGTDADRVFTFDPSTGSRTERGFLGEATGLPNDLASPTNHVYYGNATINTFNAGTIERTTSGGGEQVYRACGVASSDPCYVWGIGLDPDLTDYGIDGRIYVADGANNKVRLVPPSGLIVDFATGFSFGNSPRGITVDRNSDSTLYHDVFISDATSVRQYDSSTVPGSLVKTYDSTNSPVMSPRQMGITPTPRERLLIADDGQDRVVMINPETDASKLLDIPLSEPRGIAVDVDTGTGVAFAYVAEQTRVLKFPVHKTVWVAVWIASGTEGIGPIRIQRQIRRANSAFEQCGFEFQIRSINFFDPGNLLDLEINDWTTTNCLDPSLTRTSEEAALLDDSTRRSTEPTDLNLYFVRSFTVGATTPKTIAETVTGDCFPDVAGLDGTRSGIIFSANQFAKFAGPTERTLGHEFGHGLLDRLSWASGDEHSDTLGVPYTLPNMLTFGAARERWLFDNAQCLNMNTDTTIFRGDP